MVVGIKASPISSSLVSPAVLRPDGFVVKGGGGGDLVVLDVTVLHAERLHALVGVGGASHLDIWFSE